MNKKVNGVFILGAAAMAMVMFFTACDLVKKLDVVGKESIPSFDAMLKAAPGLVKAGNTNAAWSIQAPDSSARFLWTGDFGSADSVGYDVALEVDVSPFVSAGLDVEKLPEDYIISGNRLTVGRILGVNQEELASQVMPLEAYKTIVSRRPDVIGYHIALDHYGVDLGGGNMFEWARDLDKNDKDIVFVLDPQPLIAAGVKPEAVAGWVFAKVPVMSGGKKVEVDKFSKPFEILTLTLK
jgi:hypothetical protein